MVTEGKDVTLQALLDTRGHFQGHEAHVYGGKAFNQQWFHYK